MPSRSAVERLLTTLRPRIAIDCKSLIFHPCKTIKPVHGGAQSKCISFSFVHASFVPVTPGSLAHLSLTPRLIRCYGSCILLKGRPLSPSGIPPQRNKHCYQQCCRCLAASAGGGPTPVAERPRYFTASALLAAGNSDAPKTPNLNPKTARGVLQRALNSSKMMLSGPFPGFGSAS